jgi:hypothetical protein
MWHKNISHGSKCTYASLAVHCVYKCHCSLSKQGSVWRRTIKGLPSLSLFPKVLSVLTTWKPVFVYSLRRGIHVFRMDLLTELNQRSTWIHTTCSGYCIRFSFKSAGSPVAMRASPAYLWLSLSVAWYAYRFKFDLNVNASGNLLLSSKGDKVAVWVKALMCASTLERRFVVWSNYRGTCGHSSRE